MVVGFLVSIAGGKQFAASVFPSIILIIVAARAASFITPAILLRVGLMQIGLKPEIISIERTANNVLMLGLFQFETISIAAVLFVVILLANYEWSPVRLWVNGMSYAFHNCLEPVPFISLVLYVTLGAVGFIQSVSTLQSMTVANFPLAFMITGVGVLYTIFKFVLCPGVPVVVIITRQTCCYEGEKNNNLE